MTGVGRWKIQYGSIVEITSEANGRIEETFRTALADSGFYGQTVVIFGVHQGNCIGFSSVGSSAAGDRVVSYTGLLRDQKMEAAWFVVSDKALVATREGEAAALKPVNWWRAVTTSVDTFERST
ncbi:hypothetical protein GPL21_17555 [Bradyrhizobium pachyrhizi]|uniref:Avidin family protein n=1 Tax=Bradyrhizobium pachyrhizi TaxID=280333 RepID=A0A844SIT2_9BRAD|nr:hypothetical protein [Bradyrhizobium pachyrhizi]MVT66908.1 hypothetical protein [Bradyrhizobium pachyrhizi]WFU59358.1 hypothetical protein QA639_18385 [Bradyrhizobium pachyrhizi]